jgi:hypothetical protein
MEVNINDIVFLPRMQMKGKVISKPSSREFLIAIHDYNGTGWEITKEHLDYYNIPGYYLRNFAWMIDCWEKFVKLEAQVCKVCSKSINSAIPNQSDKSFICYECHIK